MFGPGLESETSAIVKNIFSGTDSQIIVKGMFPGKFDGKKKWNYISVAHDYSTHHLFKCLLEHSNNNT